MSGADYSFVIFNSFNINSRLSGFAFWYFMRRELNILLNNVSSALVWAQQVMLLHNVFKDSINGRFEHLHYMMWWNRERWLTGLTSNLRLTSVGSKSKPEKWFLRIHVADFHLICFQFVWQRRFPNVFFLLIFVPFGRIIVLELLEHFQQFIAFIHVTGSKTWRANIHRTAAQACQFSICFTAANI